VNVKIQLFYSCKILEVILFPVFYIFSCNIRKFVFISCNLIISELFDDFPTLVLGLRFLFSIPLLAAVVYLPYVWISDRHIIVISSIRFCALQ